MFRKLLLIVLLPLCCIFKSFSQQPPGIIDSLLKVYNSEKELKPKAALAGRLAWLYLTLNASKSDSFGKLAIEYAEVSRDRPAIAKAYRNTAERYAHLSAIKENIPKALDYYTRSYEVAKDNKLGKEMVTALLGMASVSRYIPDAEKAMSYTSKAMAIVPDNVRDSMESRCYISFGENYLLKREKLLALTNYFNALKLAESRKDPQLLRDCYITLSRFYFSVENYDKSLDYLYKATEKLNEIKDANARYLKVGDLNFRGNLFAVKNQFDLARKSFDEAIEVADQLNYDQLKLNGYVNIFTMFLLAKKPEEALAYFNTKPEIKEYFYANRMNAVVEQLYGYVYTDMNLLDSAGYYYNKSMPYFSQQTGNVAKLQFYNNYARYQLKAKRYDEAINLLNEAGTTAKQISDLEWQAEISKTLDSAYQLKGDYKTALFHSTLARKLKDSLDVLGKESDLLQLQLADEDERRARIAMEEDESRKRRHQVQYYGITVGIGVLFVLLVMLGTFKVSARTIRIVGFFTFLMLFEFIFLLLKKNFYTITHGEPWKDLGVMIGLAALLLPLHHLVEHKVIHFLTHKQLIKLDKNKYFPRFMGKKQKEGFEKVV